MVLKYMELETNGKEDNKNDNWDKIKEKLSEELNELIEAIEEKDVKHIGEEVNDTVQVLIRVFKQIEKDGGNIEQLNARHNKKIVNRKWKGKRKIKIIVED